MTSATTVQETDAVSLVLQSYMEGARTGKGAAMKPTFHGDATIYGYVGTDLFGGPIQGLFDWNDQDGPARDVQFRLTSIDVVGTCASVRIDVDHWTGHRFTDLAAERRRRKQSAHLTSPVFARRPPFDAVRQLAADG